MSNSAIRIQNFTKEYPIPRQSQKRIAVDDLSLDVSQGGLFGFLGPNGAGKTTTIKMLLGFLPATRGGAWLFDRPVWEDEARSRIGYLPEQPYFPKFLSAQEVVRAHAGLSGLSGQKSRDRADACLRIVGMYESRYMPLSKCSKGMVQRVALATALVGDPDLLILDEPSSGLDPLGRKELREMLTALKEAGKTIFVSSHLLSEMESVCDRVGILARGKLVACGAPSEITQTRSEVAVQIESAERDEVLTQEISTLGGRIEAQSDSDRSNLLIPSALVYRVLSLLETRRAKLVAVLPQQETLEDAFLRLVG
jgi:ABC-2 type transport system ATP-binding protein